MNVVVVESPAKAKTINKYLGPQYRVVASYGHVRDLSARDGSVKPDEDFEMVWEVDPKARKHLDAITKALDGAQRLYLATDPDREGEAISWHVCQVLKDKKALNGVGIHRVVFNEITRSAIEDAFAHPRTLDERLVQAYLARRALDYLVGFTLSPVLWRKLPGSRSAGRVQSVALRLICERETEIETFRSQEYWTVKGLFRSLSGGTFLARLTHLNGRKLDKFGLGTQAAAEAAVHAAEARRYAIGHVERKQVRRHPAPPFITSTLQQEASRKLSFSATHTMRVAQRLYEGVSLGGELVGLITYMRTDGVQMAADAIQSCRELIRGDFGSGYLPEKPRIYRTKAKNAQEAHEAIRPTDLFRRPAEVAPFLDADQLKLYSLIWKRTVASQMESAVMDQVAVDVVADDNQVIFRANGSVVAFDGFLKLYKEDRDDPQEGQSHQGEAEDGDDRMLPDMHAGETAERLKVEAEQHFTQPPPRYTEASLVKRLEELGIGRPSTYASILQVLQDRKYVRLESRRFLPEDRGRLVTAFLESFFDRYVAYGFTAEMEQKLDDVAGGRVDWKTVLANFWQEFAAAVGEIKGLRIKEVLDTLDRLLGPHFFGDRGDGQDSRACPVCTDGRLSLKLGKFGAFIGCSNFPDCRYTRPLVPIKADEGARAIALAGNNVRVLGTDPHTGLSVSVRRGPYGAYVQLGETNGDGTLAKPKRTSLPASADPDSLDLDQALQFLALPRTVGLHPETGEPILAGLGRYGPFVRMGNVYASLGRDEDVLTVGLNRAVDALSRGRRIKPSGRTLGHHPRDGKPVTLRAGRYGPYVEHGSMRATLPAGVGGETLDLDGAVKLLAERTGKGAKVDGVARTAARKGNNDRSKKGEGQAKPASDVRRATKGGSRARSKTGTSPKRAREQRSQP